MSVFESRFVREAGNSVLLPILALLTAAYAFVPHPAAFATGLVGWWASGGLMVLSLLFVALTVRSVWALLGACLIFPVFFSQFGLPGEVGLPVFISALLLGWQTRGNVSIVWLRLLACVVLGWMGWCFWLWFDKGVTPVLEKLGYAMFFSPGWPDEWTRPAMSLPFGNANPMSGVVLMLVPLWIGLVVHERKNKLWRTPWAIGAMLAVGMLSCGSSRPAQLAPFLAALAYVTLLPADRLKPKLKWCFGAIGIIVGGVCAALNPSMRAVATHGFGRGYSDEIRKDFFDGGLNMFLAKPWTGFGPGGVPAHYSAYMGPYSDQPGCHQLHITPLQWMAEYGVWGGLFWLLLAGLTLFGLYRAARASDFRGLRAGAAIAATAYLIYSLFDYQLYLPVTALLWGACIGLTLRGWAPPAPSRLGLPFVRGVFGVAVICGGVALVSGDAPRREMASAKRLLNAGDFAGGLDAIGRAMDADPSSPIPPFLAAQLIGFNADESVKNSPENRALADALFLRARAAAPDFPYITAIHGWLWVDADPAKAIGLFNDALRLAPKLPHAWLGLARAYALQGDLTRSVDALAKRCLILGEFWFSPSLRDGFFNGAAEPVRIRLYELMEDYRRRFPNDQIQLERLALLRRQIDAWAAADGVVVNFLNTNYDWSGRPVWKHLQGVFTEPFYSEDGPPLPARCAVQALMMYYFDRETKDGFNSEAVVGMNSRDSLAWATMRGSETFGAMDTYFGMTGGIALAKPYEVNWDWAARLFLYENSPVRPHLRAEFFQ